MEALLQVCLLNSDALLLAQTVSFPSINNNCKYMKCSVSFLVLPNEIHNLRVLFGNLLISVSSEQLFWCVQLVGCLLSELVG